MVPDVGNVYDGVCFALGHVLDDMSHHDAWSFAVSKGRCLPARCHGHSVTAVSYTHLTLPTNREV